MTADPRHLSAEETARYICVRVDALPRLVRLGRIPKPDYTLGPRSPRWDREKLDAAFNGEKASTDFRIAVRAHAESIRAEGRARREADARRREHAHLPLRPAPRGAGGAD